MFQLLLLLFREEDVDEMTDMVGSFDPTASDDFPNGKSVEQT